MNAYGALPNAPLSTDSFRMLVQQRISVALQKGNYIVETQGIQLARSAHAAQTYNARARSTILSADHLNDVSDAPSPAIPVASSAVASRSALDSGSSVGPARLLSAALSAPSGSPAPRLSVGPWDAHWHLRSAAASASSLSQAGAVFMSRG